MSTASAATIYLGITACSDTDSFILEIVPEEERIKVGIVGLGDRGGSILRVLQNVPEIKVVAICDLFNFRLEKAKEKVTNVVTEYKDFNKLLEHEGLDAIIISVPLHEHHRIVLSALDKDIHIMCEKALAHNIEQCQEIKLKAEQSSKLFQISYQYQLNPVYRTIKELVDKGYCGKITRIEAVWDRNGDWRRQLPPPELVPEVTEEELERIINWRMYKEYSGGLAAELGSHQFNMIDNLLGENPTKVIGTGGIDFWKDGRETLDNIHVIFDYPSGAKVNFHSGTTNKYEGFQLKIYGKKATIISTNMDEAFIYPEEDEIERDWSNEIDGVTGASIKIIGKDDDKKRNIEPVNEANVSYPYDDYYFNATWLLYKNFAAAINGKEKLLLGLDDGYKSAISVHMANMAARNSEIVEWQEEYNI